MKKSKLIELLNSIEGDPDILFWNGYVGDWQDVDKKLVETEQVKMTLNNYIHSVELQEQCVRKNWDYTLPESEVESLKKMYRRHIEWESNDYVTSEDIKEKRYKTRRVVYIQPKLRGQNSWDRIGSMEY